MENEARRRYPRIPVALEIRCEETTKPIIFVSKNVSVGGVFIETSHVYPVGAQLKLQCKLPYAHGELFLVGQVNRHHQDPQSGVVDGMAIEFPNLPDPDRKVIEDYIQNTEEGSDAKE